MASPQLENGHLRIANELFEQLVIRDFTKRDLVVIMCVLRLSYGVLGRKACPREVAEFSRITGLDKSTIRKTIARLVEASVFFERDRQIGVNKDHDAWRIPVRVLPWTDTENPSASSVDGIKTHKTLTHNSNRDCVSSVTFVTKLSDKKTLAGNANYLDKNDEDLREASNDACFGTNVSEDSPKQGITPTYIPTEGLDALNEKVADEPAREQDKTSCLEGQIVPPSLSPDSTTRQDKMSCSCTQNGTFCPACEQDVLSREAGQNVLTNRTKRPDQEDKTSSIAARKPSNEAGSGASKDMIYKEIKPGDDLPAHVRMSALGRFNLPLAARIDRFLRDEHFDGEVERIEAHYFGRRAGAFLDLPIAQAAELGAYLEHPPEKRQAAWDYADRDPSVRSPYHWVRTALANPHQYPQVWNPQQTRGAKLRTLRNADPAPVPAPPTDDEKRRRYVL